MIMRMKGKQEQNVVVALAGALPVEIRSGNLPRRIKVLNWGLNPNSHGRRINVNEKLPRAMSAQTYPFHRVAFDFEHNTVPGTQAYKDSAEPRKVAAYGAIEVVPGDGVYLNVEGWTPDGLAEAHNYACVSAAPVPDAAGDVIAIVSVALCRNGAVPGMDFVEAPLSALGLPQKQKGVTMDWKQLLIESLGLDASATDDAIKAALLKRLAAQDSPAPMSAEVRALVAQAVSAAITPLSTQVVDFGKELEKRDKAAIIAGAKAQGKVVALGADAVAKLSVADLTAHVEALPVTVPLTALTPPTLAPDAAAGQVTDLQRTIALNCGVDPETVWPSKK